MLGQSARRESEVSEIWCQYDLVVLFTVLAVSHGCIGRGIGKDRPFSCTFRHFWMLNISVHPMARCTVPIHTTCSASNWYLFILLRVKMELNFAEHTNAKINSATGTLYMPTPVIEFHRLLHRNSHFPSLGQSGICTVIWSGWHLDSQRLRNT